MRRELPIVDNHMHLDERRGSGVEGAKKFARAGGKAVFLVSKLTEDAGCTGVSEENFSALYSQTLKLSKKVEGVGLKVFPVLGVHPAELHRMHSQVGRARALEVARNAIDRVVELIESGEASAIGEVGRPHYRVEEGVIELCNSLTFYAMERARDTGCAVQLHTESADGDTFQDFARLAREAGLEPGRVVKHFSPPMLGEGERTGIMPSLIAKRENITGALKQGNRFMMETDFLDDNRRPGAVVGPKSVPRVTLKLLREGILEEEDVYTIHQDNVEEVYGVEILA